jgi:acetyltransferase-like isoleucine patch superfamily enzyme
VSRISNSLKWRLSRGWFGRVVREAVMLHPYIHGSEDRVTLGSGVVVNDAVLNVASGCITIGEHSFCGHGVALLTGTHQISKHDDARQKAVPDSGRDIIIGKGVWIASYATVLGPCVIGDNAVVAAGAIVTSDMVEAGTIVGGIPARVMGTVPLAD